ncbi:MAG: division/cell wall cluster transcriptional repressor MraZ [Candidatus Omnitrophica bacterium]|nr:division/cell wall cluster transcriptional repressor MraZ [Candidatus Omnitrophota bacterium]
MWYGEYTHSLDVKDRFVLPAKFREKIRERKISNFYITRGLDGCLFIFSEDVWRGLEEKLKSFSITKQQARVFNRIYFSGALEVSPDSQGRITLPLYLKEFAGIKKDIVIIGVSYRIEI